MQGKASSEHLSLSPIEVSVLNCTLLGSYKSPAGMYFIECMMSIDSGVSL